MECLGGAPPLPRNRLSPSGSWEPAMGGPACGDPRSRPALEAFWGDCRFDADTLRRLRFQSRRFDPILRFLQRRQLRPPLRVLDVGAGTGSLSVALKAHYPGTYHLADYAPPSSALAEAWERQGLGPYFSIDLTGPDPLRDLPTGYDLVLFVEVLEHLLANPIRVLRALRSRLAPGGGLLLTTPNQARLRNRWNLLRNRSIREPEAFPLDDRPLYGHVMEYAWEDLASFLPAAGFGEMDHEVVQHLPSMDPSRLQRWGSRFLGSPVGRWSGLGDDLLIWAVATAGAGPSPPEGPRVP